MNTEKQFDAALSRCRDIFSCKLHDYAPAWRVLRPASLTDQIFIKAKRIRELQLMGGDQQSAIGEDSLGEFIGIVNYGIVGLIQLSLPLTFAPDIDAREAMRLYDHYANQIKQLMLAKNHDYGEAWRDMRVSSYVDLILMKILRTKQIEDNNGSTLISEGIDANYMDMVNYSIFGIIQLTHPK